jgi:hypothetical protein
MFWQSLRNQVRIPGMAVPTEDVKEEEDNGKFLLTLLSEFTTLFVYLNCLKRWSFVCVPSAQN